ncbi:MAG: hypothetical protein RR619_10635 [Raoultibacter sp.]
MKKIFMLDTETGEMTAMGGEEQKCEIKSALERVAEELDGYTMYSGMFEKTPGDNRYNVAANQEFTHMLFALADLHAALKKRFTSSPFAEELNKFFKESV